MSLLCGLSRRTFIRKSDGPEAPARARTMSIFNRSNKSAQRAIRSIIWVSTLARSVQAYARLADGDFQISKHILEIAEDLFADLKGFDALLSKEKLYKFLKEVQCEPVVASLDQETYEVWDFRRIWLMDHGVDAVGPPPPKDLTKPLTNYFINSSHNTYLDGNQLASTSTPEAYRNVLLRGCRCIEIDVWNGEPPSRGRSKSPHVRHSRGPSRTSQSNTTIGALDSVEETYKSMKTYLGEKASLHSRTPSANSRSIAEDISPRTSVLNLPGSKSGIDEVNASRRNGPISPRLPRPRSPLRGEPIVTHGHTLTVPCGFREVCEAIKESAFVNNDMPIIISLEVHADWEQQEVMVQIMKEVWQDLLVTAPHEDFDPKFRLPKLQDLQRKILVKVKKVAPAMVPILTQNNSQDTADSATQATSQETTQSAPDLLVRTVDGGGESSTSEHDDPLMSHPKPPEKSVSAPIASTTSQSRVNTGRICQSLGDLAVYTRSEHFISFETKEAKKTSHIFSISEKRILELYQKNRRDVFLHNKNYFMRAYPDKLRVNSSNLDPSLFWRRGVQMAAMNWQRMDTGMMLNEGMFAGENGWVLKPRGYLSSDKCAESHEEAAPGATLDLRITVLAAQNIPVFSDDSTGTRGSSSALRPYVRAELHVERSEATGGREVNESAFRKRTDAGKSSNPTFKGRRKHMNFVGIPKVVPELSFLRFRVGDDSRVSSISTSVLAWACIRLDRLLPGYRFVRLRDIKGNIIDHGGLFVRIEKSLHG